MSALLFGSISTLGDTSEPQHSAFNAAFAHHGLDWTWSRERYRSMLGTSGGRDRIAIHAEGGQGAGGTDVDAAAIHRTKSQIFQDTLITTPVFVRPGVTQTIRSAQRAGGAVALVTTTPAANISALLACLHPELFADDIDRIVDVDMVTTPQPDGACVAIEDNLGGVQAATAAGVRCVAYPNADANTATAHFPTAHARVTELDARQLITLVG